ncbi:hypothetical protein [Azospirillum sp. sgz302134]
MAGFGKGGGTTGPARSVPVLLAAAGVAGCVLMPPSGSAVREDAGLTCAPLPVAGGGGSPGGSPGAEDVAVLPAADGRAAMAYVSSTDRWAKSHRREPAAGDRRIGHLYRVDLAKEPPELVDVTPAPFSTADFEPHGISVHGTGAERRLFVINHRPLPAELARTGQPAGASAVEVFRIAEDGTLSRDGDSIIDAERMPSPNDLVATGPRSFYVTNLAGSPSTAGQLAEALFGLRGFVARYDGGQFTPLTERVPLANGIALDSRSGILFVSSSADGLLRRYRVDPATPDRLEPLPPVATGTRLDNIEIAAGDELLVAGHPSATGFLLHAFFPGWSAPGQILRVAGASTADPKVTEIHRDDTGAAPAISVAAPYRDGRGGREALLVGTVFGPNALRCRYPSPAS